MAKKVERVNFSKLLYKNSPQLRIKVGDTVFGRIFGFLDGKVVGIFNGVPLLAQTDLPLKVGQRILARVADIKNGKYILKILDENSDVKPEDRLQEVLFSLGVKGDKFSVQVLKRILAYKIPLQKDFFLLAHHIAQKSGFSLGVFLRLSSLNFPLFPEIYNLVKDFDPYKKLKKEISKLKSFVPSELKEVFSNWEAHKKENWSNYSPELRKDLLLWQKAYGIDILPLKIKGETEEEEKIFILKAKKEDSSYILGIEGEIWNIPFDCKLVYFIEPVKRIYVQFFSLPTSLHKMFREFTEKILSEVGIDFREIIFTEGSSWEDDEPSYVGKLPLTKVDVKV